MTLNYETVAFTFNYVKKPSAPTECRESMISRYVKGNNHLKHGSPKQAAKAFA
jgi:hypothetical protein